MERLSESGDGWRNCGHASSGVEAARRPTERLDGSGGSRRSNCGHVSTAATSGVLSMLPPSESVRHHRTEDLPTIHPSGSTIQARPCASGQSSQVPNPARGLDMGAGTNSSATRSISERVVETARSISRTQKAARSKKRKELNMAVTDDASSPLNARQVQMDSHSSTPLVEVSQAVQKRRRRKRASTSEVWQHFHEPAKEPNVASIATCKYCGKEYTWVPENGTGTLWQHLKHRCPEDPLKDVEEPRREHGTPKNSFNYEDCRKDLSTLSQIKLEDFVNHVLGNEGKSCAVSSLQYYSGNQYENRLSKPNCNCCSKKLLVRLDPSSPENCWTVVDSSINSSDLLEQLNTTASI